MSEASIGANGGTSILRKAQELLPGIVVAVTIAAAATFVSDHYGGPTMLYALLIGLALPSLSREGACAAGVAFVAKRVLRIGVALLGLRITFEQVAGLGAQSIALVAGAVAATMLCGVALARCLGRRLPLGILTGGAVAICGASAAAAISSVLPKDRQNEQDTAFTIIAVTALSTIAMIVYPAVGKQIGLDETQMGIFIGASIHDVAQVVGAGYSVSTTAGDTATYIKLLRVTLLVPTILVLSLVFARGRGEGKRFYATVPLFVITFAALIFVNSLQLLPPVLHQALQDASRWCLIAAIAAIGMKTSLVEMARLGPRHAALVVGETLFLAIIVLFLLTHWWM